MRRDRWASSSLCARLEGESPMQTVGWERQARQLRAQGKTADEIAVLLHQGPSAVCEVLRGSRRPREVYGAGARPCRGARRPCSTRDVESSSDHDGGSRLRRGRDRQKRTAETDLGQPVAVPPRSGRAALLLARPSDNSRKVVSDHPAAEFQKRRTIFSHSRFIQKAYADVQRLSGASHVNEFILSREPRCAGIS